LQLGCNVGHILNLPTRQMQSKLLSNNATNQHTPNHVPIGQITTSPQCDVKMWWKAAERAEVLPERQAK